MKRKILMLLLIVICLIKNDKVFADETCDKLKKYSEFNNICRYINLSESTPSYIYLYTSENDTMIEDAILDPFSDNPDDKIKYSEGRKDVKYDSGGRDITNYINTNSCPMSIYRYSTWYWAFGHNVHGEYKYTLDDDSDKYNVKSGFDAKWVKYEIDLDCNNQKPTPEPEEPEEISCDLIDQDIIDIINEVMSYIRIGVPILLAGLIIFDFASAMFASSEDKMKKAQSKAIKRIIIAVIIFFVPTFINLIFNIANDVWSNSHYETCGIK